MGGISGAASHFTVWETESRKSQCFAFGNMVNYGWSLAKAVVSPPNKCSFYNILYQI